MLCPHCGSNISRRLVAKSIKQDDGQYRIRHCSCGAEVSTIEVVINAPKTEYRIISGIVKHDLAVVRRLVESLGGKVWR